MNRTELEKAITNRLSEDNKRKPVFYKKQVFHISDNEGNSKDFVLKQTEKEVLYTQNDVAAFMEAFIDTISDAIKNGETISIHDFGRFELKYHKGSRARHPATGELFSTDPYLCPKFTFGKSLRRCAKIFELNHPEFLDMEPKSDKDEESDI